MPRENSDLPSLENLRIAADALQSWLGHAEQVDQVLFGRFTPPQISALQGRLRHAIGAGDATPLPLQDWDDLSLLLRSMSLSLVPFPDLTEKYQRSAFYTAVDQIAEYALTLPEEPPGKVNPPRGRVHGL